MGFQTRLTSFRRTKVFARSRCARTAATSLLDAQSAAFDDFTLQTFLGSIRLLTGDHLHEAKATRLLGVRVNHDGAVLDVTVLLEQARQIRLGQTRVNASDKKVGTGILGTLFVIVEHLTGVDRASLVSTWSLVSAFREQAILILGVKQRRWHTGHQCGRWGSGSGHGHL